jgi:hypothetical protein
MAATLAMSSLALDSMACLDGLDHGLGGLLDAALEEHRVGAGGHVLQALGDDRLRQHRGGGGAVAGDVVGLGGRFLQKLGAHVLEGVLQLDLLGHGHAVVGDGGRAPLLVQRDVAALGAQRGLHGVGQGVASLAR